MAVRLRPSPVTIPRIAHHRLSLATILKPAAHRPRKSVRRSAYPTSRALQVSTPSSAASPHHRTSAVSPKVLPPRKRASQSACPTSNASPACTKSGSVSRRRPMIVVPPNKVRRPRTASRPVCPIPVPPRLHPWSSATRTTAGRSASPYKSRPSKTCQSNLANDLLRPLFQ